MGGEVESIHKIYGNPSADVIAQELGITRETYWLNYKELSEFLDSMTEEYQLTADDRLLPIFPAEVYKHEASFASAAKREGIPVNILAIVTTIESAGVADATTASGAVGLNLIKPKQYGAEIREIARGLRPDATMDTDEKLVELVKDPEVNIAVAAAILRDYLNKAQKSGHERNKPSTLGRAFAAYNSDESALVKEYYDWSRDGDAVQTQLYALMGLTFMLDAEVAARMRVEGANDIEIRHALSSDKLAATVWAYIKQGENMEWKGSKDIKDFEYRRSTLLSLPESKKAIVEHMNHEHKFLLENLPVAMRIWTVHGGLGLFGRSAENMNPINYR